MDARQLVAERGLLGSAASALATHALTALPFESLGPTKGLLKRYFSSAPWDATDDELLAATVGPGEGWWREPLADDLVLEFGWVEGRFRLRVEGAGAQRGRDPGDESRPGPDALAATFEGDVVPEATPNPRTLVFRTGPLHEGESRSYAATDDADDPRVARLLRSFPDVATVLVAHDFVAVTLRRPDRWEALLLPVLAVVTEQFAGDEPRGAGVSPVPRRWLAADEGPERVEGPDPRAVSRRHHPPGEAGIGTDDRDAATGERRRDQETRLERAWRELASVRPEHPGDLERVLAAAREGDSAHRQVAARLLLDAAPGLARAEWTRLVMDGSRAVRRSAVDAVVDAGREELRPILEGALRDADAWIRWKALRGLVELGVEPSRDLIEPLGGDADFRVRLEALSALRG